MKTYSLTPQQFTALRSKLLEAGITVPSDITGVLSFKNIELKYTYTGGSLTLSILKRPILIPPSMIWDAVDGWIAGL